MEKKKEDEDKATMAALTWETTATLDVNAGTNFNINGSMAT